MREELISSLDALRDCLRVDKSAPKDEVPMARTVSPSPPGESAHISLRLGLFVNNGAAVALAHCPNCHIEARAELWQDRRVPSMIPEEAPMDGQAVHSETGNPTDAAASEQPRLLWRVAGRKQFREQIITAAIYRHPLGQELRILLGAEEVSNLLHSELARLDSAPLEEKAAVMREVLIQKGWRDLGSSTDAQPAAR